jgi:uncharacterized membrane protein
MYLVGLGGWLYLATRWGFAALFVLDRGQGPLQALSSSWRLTAGKVGALMCYNAVLGLLLLLGYAACVVGLLFLCPFAVLAHAAAYLGLTGQPVRGGGRRD